MTAEPMTTEDLDTIRGAIARSDLIDEETLPLAFSDRKRLLAEVDRLRAENARLAAQDRVSGPETPQGHPSEGTGAPGAHARSETHIDTIARILIGTDWDEEVRYTDIGTRETVAHLAGQIATVLASAHYREAAASLRALGHDTAADALMDTIGSSLTDTARAVVAAVRPHLAAEPPVHDGIHHYLSTGCLHGDTVLLDGRTGHQYCQGMTGMAGAKRPATCKFCDAPCQCPCHQTNTEGDPR